MMTYERLLKNNLVKKEKPDFKQISLQIKRAQKDLKTARAVLSFDLTWAFTIAYHAMIRAGRALKTVIFSLRTTSYELK